MEDDKKKNPYLSIGLPVFNGEKYLCEAIDSILCQTFSDFELIISDNASTDRTQIICRNYMTKDNRIKYYRNKKNLRAVKNHNRIFEVSSGKFFKWASYDDVLEPNFLLKCINVLDKDPSIVLCHSKTCRIDENGSLKGVYNYSIIFDSKLQPKFFGKIISEHYNSWILFFGVIRVSSLKKTSLVGEFIGADRNLLAQLALLGKMFEVPEYLFFRRDHPEAYSSKIYLSNQKKLAWWTQDKSNILPHVKIFQEYIKSVRKISLNSSVRILCYKQLFIWLLKEGIFLIAVDLGKVIFSRSKIGSVLSHFVYKFLRLFVYPRE